MHFEAIQATVQTVAGDPARQDRAAASAAVVAEHGSIPSARRPTRTSTCWTAPLLNAKSDDYEPVGFSHRIHDELTGGDCGVCHHRYATAEGDRVGMDIKELHAPMDIKLGGPCSSCHDDMAKNPPQSCSRCHGLPNEPDEPSRIGLKGAYHRQCIGCHERQLKPASAPTDCASCHHPWTPDHSDAGDLHGQAQPAGGDPHLPELPRRRWDRTC